MKNAFIRISAIIALAGASFAQQTPPAPPAAPAAPATSSQQESDAAAARQQMEEARKQIEDARAQAEQARAEAQKEAAKARAEARKEAYKARAEARRARAAARNMPYLGVGARDLTPERAASLKLSSPKGAEVYVVDQDSPAGKAGLKEHDVIVSFNGKPVNSYDDLKALMHASKPDAQVKIGVIRAGNRIDVPVTLGRRDARAYAWMGANGGKIEVPNVPIPPIPPIDIDIPSFTVLQFTSRNGVMVEDLSPQLAEFFGVREGRGVLVRSVDRGSAADTAGLKAGDVIVKVGTQPVTCSADWRRAVREHKTGPVPFAIIRDKREQTVTVRLPDHSSDARSGFTPDFDRQMAQMQRKLDKIGPQIQQQLEASSKVWSRQLREEIERQKPEIERALREAQKSIEGTTK